MELRPGSSLEQVRQAYDKLVHRVREERLDTVERSYRALVSLLEHPDVVSSIPSEDGLRIGEPVGSPADFVDSVEEPKKELSPSEVRFEATSMPKRPSVLFLMALGLIVLVLYGVTYHSLAGLLAESLGWSRSQVQFGMNAMVPLFIVALIEIGRRARSS